MALKGIDIFKMSPKKNCKECGCPTCMAFSMKVAQGALPLDKCPYFSEEAKAKMSEATAPAMKTIKAGAGDKELAFGGETVLFRHEKTFVNRTRYAVKLTTAMDEAAVDAKIKEFENVDYERIGEREFVEMVEVSLADGSSKDAYVALVKKAAATGRVLILDVEDPEIAEAAVAEVKADKPVLNGATKDNFEAMNKIATENGLALGVKGADLNEIYDTLAALEKAGNKNLFFNTPVDSIKNAYAAAVEFRRAAIKDTDRTCGYPSIVDAAALSAGDKHLQAALLSLFTVKYGSIVVVDQMTYAEANPVYGLRQNIFTDPQKPMKVQPGVYPINGGDENSIVLTTVDFALTYFVVSGELERSGIPCNLVINDAGGLSVLTSWAAGKFSTSSIAKFFEEQGYNEKFKCHKLCIPGKVAAMKGELEAKMPGWEIIVAPREAVQLVKFLKDMKANGEI